MTKQLDPISAETQERLISDNTDLRRANTKLKLMLLDGMDQENREAVEAQIEMNLNKIDENNAELDRIRVKFCLDI